MRTRGKMERTLSFKLNWIWMDLIFMSLGQQDPDFKKPPFHLTLTFPSIKWKSNIDRDLPLILQPKEETWRWSRGSQFHFHPRRPQSIPHFFSTCTITAKHLQADILFSLSSNDTISDKITTSKLQYFLAQGLETGSPTCLPPAQPLKSSFSLQKQILYTHAVPPGRAWEQRKPLTKALRSLNCPDGSHLGLPTPLPLPDRLPAPLTLALPPQCPCWALAAAPWPSLGMLWDRTLARQHCLSPPHWQLPVPQPGP